MAAVRLVIIYDVALWSDDSLALSIGLGASVFNKDYWEGHLGLGLLVH